ncbi:MAG: hypothetical protein CSYNP_00906 [Syntrophus sp. SKADARSKE-3]|nr:hypothetical protein [Syntrophus sp. SKADARSKE-3]
MTSKASKSTSEMPVSGKTVKRPPGGDKSTTNHKDLPQIPAGQPDSKSTRERKSVMKHIDIKSQNSGDNAVLFEKIWALSNAINEGKLEARADLTGATDSEREILESVNQMIDTIVAPLNVTAEYVDRISKGDIPPKITDTYNGDFNEIKNNINNCIDGLGGLVECDRILHRMSINDYTKGVEGNYIGIYASMAKSTNEVRDRLLGVTRQINEIAVGNTAELAELKKVGKRCEEDKVLPAVIECMETIEMLINDTGMLAKASVDGKLATRADAGKHRGEYRKIIQGVNETLDAVIGPLNVAAEYVDRISKGDIPPKITDNYNGDFNEIKNNLNQCLDVMSGLLKETNTLIQATQDGKLQMRGNAQQFPGGWGELVGGVNKLIDAFVGPINVTAEYVDRISKGDIPPKITDTYNGDFNEIKNNLNQCLDVMSGLLKETNALIQATQDGKLQMRGNAQQFAGGWGELVGGVNKLIDAFVGPINVTAEYVDRISKGDIPPKITDTYNGDFNEIKNNLNQCLDVMSGLLKETNALIQATQEGKLQMRGNAQQFPGGWGELVGGVNKLIDAFVGPINVTAEYVDRISKGDIPPKITDTYNGDFNEIKNNLNQCLDVMSGLLKETNTLIQATQDGKLQTRGNAQQFAGGWGELVGGINKLIDAFVGPLNVTAEYVDRISKGDIPPKITDTYNGDFNEIKNNINNCIDGLGGLVECDRIMHRMTLNDHTKSVEGNYIGIYASMAKSTNEVRDRLLGVTRQINEIAVGNTAELAELKRIGKRCEEDKVLPAVIGCMETIEMLINDTGMLATAAVDGKLATRADAGKHHGEYRKIIQGVNETLDAVIGPLNVAAEYVDRISKGDIPPKISDNYKGDFNEIKNNLNVLIDSMNEITGVAEQIADGNLVVDVRERSEQDRLMQALILMLEKLTEVVTNVQVASDQVATGSQEMSGKTEQISQGATEQAASAEGGVFVDGTDDLQYYAER